MTLALLEIMTKVTYVLTTEVNSKNLCGCFSPLSRLPEKYMGGRNRLMITLIQRPLYGGLISELISQVNRTICFCFSVTKTKINHRIRIPKITFYLHDFN